MGFLLDHLGKADRPSEDIIPCVKLATETSGYCSRFNSLD